METSDEDKLIANGEMFYSVRTYMRQKKPSAEIIAKIEELLNQGADINACDGNDNNNTILHIAIQKEEKDVIKYILERGAHFFSDHNKQSALHLALQKNTAIGKEIVEILSTQCNTSTHNKSENLINKQIESRQNHQKPNIITAVNAQEYTYSKRGGTSGVSGQFYETKLLSLVLHRALHDKDIKEFYLAANIKDIGDFDDVCFRYDNVACFMQTKHRENTDKAKLTVASVRSSTGKLGLGIYFDSFLKIRQKFSPNATDPMFQGKFEDVECYFVLYTPLKESFERKLSGNKPICNKLHEIIFTGESKTAEKSKSTDMFQFDFEDRDLDMLTGFIKHDHMKTLAKTFLEFILSNNKLEAMMASDLIKIYHPALAQKVIFITKEVPKPVKNTKNSKTGASNATTNANISSYMHVGRFRSEFFCSENRHLNILKETFFKEIVFTHSGKSELTKDELQHKINEMSTYPCAQTISQLIGSPIKFDDTTDKLILDVNKLPKNMFKHDEIQKVKFTLQNIPVTKTMVANAVNLAGEKKLRNLSFQLPQSFGNMDLTTNQKTQDGLQSRLDFLAGKFQKLIEHYSERNKNKETKIIDINSDVIGPGKILEHTHLSSNGGIGGAVGNLLEFDVQSECFIFNTNYYLGENSKYVLNKIKELTNENLDSYKINVVIDSFPRVSFDVYKYDKNIAAMFFKKLWFYTNQAQEEIVETAIKNEINIHYNADKQRNQFLFHVHSDAIFLRFHDKIQKWWKRQTDAQYLTKSTTIYEKAKQDIVDSPLLTVLNVMFIRKIKTLDIEFNINAIDHLNLDEFMKNDVNKALNIVSEAVMLSAAKIMQINKYKNQTTFINLDYIHILPENDYETMMKELQVVKDITLVIISETPINQGLQDTLQNILNAFTKHNETTLQSNNQIIIITGKPLLIYQKQVLPNYEYVTLKDNNVNLIDLTSRSQTSFLETCEVTYQGHEVKLNTIIDDSSKDLIVAKLLWSFLNKEKMDIGHALDTYEYNEIKNYFITRNLKRDDEDYVVNTLDDADDKVVLISSKPCMGKTTLLTHLSLETKKVDPKRWIVRIDLSLYNKCFEKLNKQNINTIITYLGKAALKHPDGLNKVTFTATDNKTVGINSVNSDNVSFELQLFIHFYNTGNIIFLFDGFEKCYPQNTNEGIELITALEQADKRIWITGDYYVISILENKFGTAYKLESLSMTQQKSFLERFWKTNLRLEKLNHDQFNNIMTFFNYILRAFNRELKVNEMHERPVMPMFSIPLHVLYLTIIDHFKNEANSISACYFRDKFKRELSLDSYTKVDHYLRTCHKDEDESLQLSGTPLHLYIAANYFVFQMTDKFDLHLDTKLIHERSDLYINAVTLFERFLKSNIKTICEVEDKNEIGSDQERARSNFFETHKKLALYAIYKECDIVNILTPTEILEAKKTIQLIESGEIKTGLIDSVIDGVPRFYHALFAEYFIVEFLADLLKRIKDDRLESINPTSFWNFLVNAVLIFGPPSLRNAFEYKLKHNPELAEVTNESKKITLDLLLKPNETENANVTDTGNAIDIAINEGLMNIANFLMKNVPPNQSIENIIGRTTTILQSSANILVAVKPNQTILSEDMLKCIQNPSGETIMQVLNSNQQTGDNIHNTIKEKIVKPITEFGQNIREASDNNENIVRLFNEVPKHLPDFVRQMFPKE